MKILQGPLYVSRECDCWGRSVDSLTIRVVNPTKSWSWMGLHHRSVSWNGDWSVSDIFIGLDSPFTEMDLEWVARQKARR